MQTKRKDVKEPKAEYPAKRKAAPENTPQRNYQFTVVIEPDEDGFHAYAPALPGCHTFGSDIDEARANIVEAMELHVESMLADGEQISHPL